MTPKWSSCQATIKRVVLIAKTRLLLVVSVAIHTIGQILILLLLYIFFYYLKLNVTFINVLTMDVRVAWISSSSQKVNSSQKLNYSFKYKLSVRHCITSSGEKLKV